MACLYLLRDELSCAIYVDTGFTYPETFEMVRHASEIIPLHVVATNREMQNAENGIPSDIVPVDWTKLGMQVTSTKPIMVQSYIDCCLNNISLPLLQKAQQLGVTELVYGQRNDEAHRGTARDGDVIGGIRRSQPIEAWTSEQVLSFLSQHMELPSHFNLRHSSLDCYDCTAFRADSADRIAWMASRYPAKHAEYQKRKDALDRVMEEALYGVQ